MPKHKIPSLLRLMAPVSIQAAEAGEDGAPKGPPKFEVVAYTGGAMTLNGWDMPVVVDLDGLGFGKSLVANLDHEPSKRVGNVTSKAIVDGELILGGVASAATEARREVIESAADTFVWQASIEATPDVITEVAAGKTTTVNGQEFTGPLYVAAKSTLKGFAFVSHGADDNTTVSIAATADKPKEKNVDTKVKQFIEACGFDVDALTPEQIAGIEANYKGLATPERKPIAATSPFEEHKIEARRKREISEIGDKMIRSRQSSESEIDAIESLVAHAIESSMDVRDFRQELNEAFLPQSRTIIATAPGKELSGRVLEAAVCQAARMPDLDDHYKDHELQAAHDHFKGRIGLKQLLLLGAKANGHETGYSNEVNRDTLKAAFAQSDNRRISATGFSTLSIGTVVSNTANKFIMRGWNSVNQAALQIAKIQNVSDFKTITTVSLTDNLSFEKVGADGQIKHGTLDELTYTNKADTYARMLAITRQDIINDDLGALTDVPMKLGNGAMKKLNDIFWTEFLSLVGSGFFALGNNNLNDGVATMTSAGLSATEVIFMNQTNPDGTPLGAEPTTLVVPTALKTAANTLMDSEKVKGDTNEPDGNPWRGRFNVISAPYISNTSYTGNTSVGWWMLGDKETMPVIAIAALFGQVTPTVDTAEADFNVLGVQMRGYSDVGVSSQEYRGGVYADGGAS